MSRRSAGVRVRSRRADRGCARPRCPAAARRQPRSWSAISTSSTASTRPCDAINLDIAANRITAFIGPSGCGKSTLLRTFNRIYELYPEQRRPARFCSTASTPGSRHDLNRLRAKVGMVFQKPTPFPMSIYDNIAFGVRLYERLTRRGDGRARRVGAAQGRPVGRGQGQAAPGRAPRCRAASSSGCASRARSRSSPRSCCWTSRLRRWTRSRPRTIEELITSSRATTRSSSSPITCNRPRACRRLHGVPVPRPADRVHGAHIASSPTRDARRPKTTLPAASAEEQRRQGPPPSAPGACRGGPVEGSSPSLNRGDFDG